MPYEPHIDKVLNKIASGEETSEAEQLLKLKGISNDRLRKTVVC